MVLMTFLKELFKVECLLRHRFSTYHSSCSIRLDLDHSIVVHFCICFIFKIFSSNAEEVIADSGYSGHNETVNDGIVTTGYRNHGFAINESMIGKYHPL